MLARLHQQGYRALLVGGCVRDLFLQRTPKDFDIATDATPEQVCDLFRNSRMVGRRFKLVHIRFGRDVIEVATFRSTPKDAHNIDSSGRLLQDNHYGTIEEDAIRRDFTVNALYYDYADQCVLDITNGVDDLTAGKLCLIGHVNTRYREDPVRMLRAIRFAAKLNFTIAPESADAMHELHYLLADIPPARLFDETVKLFSEGASSSVYKLLNHYRIFEQLFPQTAHALTQAPWVASFIEKALQNTDLRVAQGKPITPAFIYAVFLWWPVYQRLRLNKQGVLPPATRIYPIAEQVLKKQITKTAIPRRYSTPMMETYALQSHLEFYTGRKALKLLEKKRFRMAYDFLELRALVANTNQQRYQWWQKVQEVEPDQQQAMLPALKNISAP